MRTPTRPTVVVGLQWVVGLVVLVESLKLAFAPAAAQHFARIGMPAWMRPALAWTEIAAAILFLVPFTTAVGGCALLVVFFLAAALHILHGQFEIGALFVYAMAVLVSMTYRGTAREEPAHD